MQNRPSNAPLRRLPPCHAPANAQSGCGGGVAANLYLRERIKQAAEVENFTLFVPPPALCTDNAAMIARAGAERFAAGLVKTRPMAAIARARWPLANNKKKWLRWGRTIGACFGLEGGHV